MDCSKTGQFYGTTNDTIHLTGVTLTDTEYSHDRVPWHFHENNYFTFILEGGMTEVNKKEVYECKAGDLLFHNWQDAHYNIASRHFTRGFHIELSDAWFRQYDLFNTVTQGSIRISDPAVKTAMYKLLRTMKLDGCKGEASTDVLLLDIFGHLSRSPEVSGSDRPKWVARIREMLHDCPEDRSLRELALDLQVHPVHLSRQFSKYFGMTLGDYVRAIRLQKALTLLTDPSFSLTEIALECGFADQSHFIRTFKGHYHTTPLQYRKLLAAK